MAVSLVFYSQAGAYQLASDQFVCHAAQKRNTNVLLRTVVCNNTGGGFNGKAITLLGRFLVILDRYHYVLGGFRVVHFNGLKEMGR